MRPIDPPVFHGIQTSRSRAPHHGPLMVDPGEHLGLARMVAVRYGADKAAITDSWQYADALLALTRAAQDFDPERGLKFTTLAVTYMKKQVLQGINMLRRPRRQLPGTFTVSLSEIAEGIPDPESVPHPARREECELLLRHLGTRSRRMVEAYYLRGETLRQIGDAEGVTYERVRQILVAALKTMRRAAA